MESDKQLDRLFFALSDSDRRHMLMFVSEQKRSVGEIARECGMSLATVSKHIRLLEQAALIFKVKIGRQVFCSMNYDTWLEVAKFTSLFAQFWNNRLDELEHYIENYST